MANEDQWKREIEVRKVGELDPARVVDLLCSYGPSNERFLASIDSVTLHDGAPLSSYRYCIVMPAADRSLDDIYKKERPEEDQLRPMMRQLAEAVAHCHERQVVHGDLKMLNVLRVDGSIRLIDMDASAVLKRDYSGAKFSSGILPPEMLFELETEEQEEQYLRYWSKEKESESELWHTKLQPVRTEGFDPKTIVIKSFRTQHHSKNKIEEAVLDGLPYMPVHSSISLDVWSFGLILFSLLAGKPLVPVNRDDDLDSPEAFLKAATWTDASLEVAIRKATKSHSSASTDLLMHLLRVKPEDRYQSMAEVLAHPFFTGNSVDSLMLRNIAAKLDEVNERTKVIDERTQQMHERLDVIMNLTAKLEFKSNRMPHTFVIKPKKIEDPSTIDATWRQKISSTFNRTTQRATALLWEKSRLVFVCPVTGCEVKCGPDSKGIDDPDNGYLISLPTEALKMIIPALRWGIYFAKIGLSTQGLGGVIPDPSGFLPNLDNDYLNAIVADVSTRINDAEAAAPDDLDAALQEITDAQQEEAVNKIYDLIADVEKKLKPSNNPDWLPEFTGLIKITSDVNGMSMWISKTDVNAQHEYKARGVAALGITGSNSIQQGEDVELRSSEKVQGASASGGFVQTIRSLAGTTSP